MRTRLNSFQILIVVMMTIMLGACKDDSNTSSPTKSASAPVAAKPIAVPASESVMKSAAMAEPQIATCNLLVARSQHIAILLPSGKVLVAGGSDNVRVLNSSELYDPTTCKFSKTGSLNSARHSPTATLLPDGKVLITGGVVNHVDSPPYSSSSLSSAELYDSTTGIFTATGNLNSARSGNTATLLPNGKVLVVGGSNLNSKNGIGSASAELYDPTTGKFTTTGNLNTPRGGHTATLLPNSRVLVAGGENNEGHVASAEIYDSATGTFSKTGSLIVARSHHTATLLPNGKVLMAGGMTSVENTIDSYSSAELYDPATGKFTATGELNSARGAHTATLLPNGMVLVAGGYGVDTGVDASELYNSSSGTFTATGKLITGRYFHTATLLSNGKVLVVGGWTASTELYDPASGNFGITLKTEAR